MLCRPDVATLRALDNLRRTQPWQSVEKFLAAEIDQTVERLLASRDQAEMLTLQGRARALKDFLAAVRDAEATISKAPG